MIKTKKESVLFAEQIGNLYRISRLNYLTNTETVLSDFEQEIYSFRAFTVNSFYWCDCCENSQEPHILYEYDSRTEQISKLYELEDFRISPEHSCTAIFITHVQPDDCFIYFYMDGGFGGDSGNIVIDCLTGEVTKNEADFGWSIPGGRYKNKLIRECASVSQTGSARQYKSKGCVIFDIITLGEV